MKFSIIIPIFNSEPYLDKCFNSLICQSFKDWEVICVNDETPDDSMSVILKYVEEDNRFRYINKPHGGLADTRNFGIKDARGEYLLFLDPDDWIDDNTLRVLNDSLLDEDVLCFTGRRFYEKNNTFSEKGSLIPCNTISGMDYYDKYSMNNSIIPFECVWSRVYKRQFLLQNQLYFKKGVLHEDFLFTPLVCFYAKKVSVIDASLYFYRIRNGSISSSQTSKDIFDFVDSNNYLVNKFVKGHLASSVFQIRSTQTYQILILRSNRELDKQLRKSIDWNAYKMVSRTSFRHRFNYLINRINFPLFRMLCR